MKELKVDPQAKIDQQTSQLQTAETELNKKLEQAKASGQDKDRKSTRLNSSHITRSRMPSSA